MKERIWQRAANRPGRMELTVGGDAAAVIESDPAGGLRGHVVGDTWPNGDARFTCGPPLSLGMLMEMLSERQLRLGRP